MTPEEIQIKGARLKFPEDDPINCHEVKLHEVTLEHGGFETVLTLLAESPDDAIKQMEETKKIDGFITFLNQR